PDPSALLTEDDRRNQARLRVTLRETQTTNAVELPDAHRIPLVCETAEYELLQCRPDGRTFEFAELARAVAALGDGKHDLPYEAFDAPPGEPNVAFRRLLDRTRTVFRANSLAGMLPDGSVESLALPGAQYKLVLTPGLLQRTFGPKLEDPAAV